MSSILGTLRWSMHHRGLGGTVRATWNWLRRKIIAQPPVAMHPFDAEHGTDTGGLIAGANLASGQASDMHIAGYAAVPPSRFRGIVDRWQADGPAHALSEYCFVDLGCGKGRAVLLASEMGFREVVGVELNPSLAAIARVNTQMWSAAGKARSPIRIEEKDALELEWPAGPCVVFLFNPFDAEMVRQVMERMRAGFWDRPSELEILYYKPEHAHVFATGFEMQWCEVIGISAQELAVDPVADPNDETRAYRLVGSGT